MVNKQYTIQKSPPKLNPRQSSLGLNSGGAGGNKTPPTIRHPNNCNLGTISEESNRLQQQQIKMDNENLNQSTPPSPPTQPPALGYEYQSEYKFSDNVQKHIINEKNSLPGRFQYILQMDKEMGNHHHHIEPYELPPKQNLSKSASLTSANSNSINSTNTSYLKFWRTNSQNHILESNSVLSSRSRRFKRAQKFTKLFAQYAKWPLLFLLILGTISLFIYFIIYEINNIMMTDDNQNNNDEYGNSNLISLNSLGDNKNNLDKNSKFVLHKNTIFQEILEVDQNYLNKFVERGGQKLPSTPFDLDKDLDTPTTTDIINGHAANFNNITTTESSELNTSNVIGLETVLSSSENIRDEFDDYHSSTTARNSFKEKKPLLPTKGTYPSLLGFTSGHQNNFGVPIEEDERWLAFIDALRGKNSSTTNHVSTTDSSTYRTRVSPTLPVINKFEITTEGLRRFNTTDEGICQSTSLSLCRGILHYDLTTSNPSSQLSSEDFQHFRHLVDSQCSLRVAQFVCAVLEPECRPTKMGTLKPCKRICKSVLEPCAHIIASSEILTSTFDCDSYPNSDDVTVCEDPTRRSKCYDNEFQCGDKACIPIQWKCDNIKDCPSGDDEENCKFCAHDEFRCPTNEKCIPDKWRCDGNDDCPDAADEYDCYDDDYEEDSYGEFSTQRTYPTNFEQLPSKPFSRPYLTITGEDRLNSAEGRKTLFGEQQDNTDHGQASDDGDPIYFIGTQQVISIANQTASNPNNTTANDTSSLPREITTVRNLDNFQDSKEIMMTSETETDYKYTSTAYSTISTSHSSPCPENELRCISGLCITTSQLCDKKVDCPDGADEAMCVYEN